jgi:hypothetical protein
MYSLIPQPDYPVIRKHKSGFIGVSVTGADKPVFMNLCPVKFGLVAEFFSPAILFAHVFCPCADLYESALYRIVTLHIISSKN